MKIEFLERIYASTDWATLLFLAALFVVAYNRYVFSSQFSDFSKLLVSDKYIKIYRDPNNINTWFTLSLVFVQFVALAFIIHLALSSYLGKNIHDIINFIQIINILIFLIIAKYLIEKISAIVFGLEDFIDQFNLVKINYRSYVGLILLPIAMLFFYNPYIDSMAYYITLGVVVAINIFIYALILRVYRKYFTQYFYYFILYLCTFEIAPYYILYKWFMKFGI